MVFGVVGKLGEESPFDSSLDKKALPLSTPEKSAPMDATLSKVRRVPFYKTYQ